MEWINHLHVIVRSNTDVIIVESQDLSWLRTLWFNWVSWCDWDGFYTFECIFWRIFSVWWMFPWCGNGDGNEQCKNNESFHFGKNFRMSFLIWFTEHTNFLRLRQIHTNGEPSTWLSFYRRKSLSLLTFRSNCRRRYSEKYKTIYVHILTIYSKRHRSEWHARNGPNWFSVRKKTERKRKKVKHLCVYIQ